jgi:hypothetical protein
MIEIRAMPHRQTKAVIIKLSRGKIVVRTSARFSPVCHSRTNAKLNIRSIKEREVKEVKHCIFFPGSDKAPESIHLETIIIQGMSVAYSGGVPLSASTSPAR